MIPPRVHAPPGRPAARPPGRSPGSPPLTPPSPLPRRAQVLFATYRDGGVLTPSTARQCEGGNVVNCTAKLQPVDNEVGYTDAWRARIVADSDNAQRYLVPASAFATPEAARREAAKQAVVEGKRRTRAAAAA